MPSTAPCCFIGEASIANVKLVSPYVFDVELRTQVPPAGFKVPEPEDLGTNTLKHRTEGDEIVGLGLYRWREGTDVSQLGDTNVHDPADVDADRRCELIADVMLRSEQAIKKQTQGGGEVTEYRIALRFKIDSSLPLASGELEWLLKKQKTIISLHPKQLDWVEAPVEAPSPVRRIEPKDTQQTLSAVK